MGARAAPEFAAVAPVAAVSWQVSSSKNMHQRHKVIYRSGGKRRSHSTVPRSPRHVSVFPQLQSISSDVKDIFQ